MFLLRMLLRMLLGLQLRRIRVASGGRLSRAGNGFGFCCCPFCCPYASGGAGGAAVRWITGASYCSESHALWGIALWGISPHSVALWKTGWHTRMILQILCATSANDCAYPFTPKHSTAKRTSKLKSFVFNFDSSSHVSLLPERPIIEMTLVLPYLAMNVAFIEFKIPFPWETFQKKLTCIGTQPVVYVFNVAVWSGFLFEYRSEFLLIRLEYLFSFTGTVLLSPTRWYRLGKGW